MNGSVDPATVGKSNEMYAIAAVVIGGISMSGGKGKLVGVMFGAMSYTIIDKIIASLGFDALINDTIKGSILLLAVLVQIGVPMIRGKIESKSNKAGGN
jgi:ribose transport system permease protein